MTLRRNPVRTHSAPSGTHILKAGHNPLIDVHGIALHNGERCESNEPVFRLRATPLLSPAVTLLSSTPMPTDIEEGDQPKTDPRRRMRGVDRRRLIQKRAAELFSVLGYQQTSMRDIGDAAGIQKGTLYHFYRNKEELLYDLFRAALEIPQQRFREVSDAGGDSRAKLRLMIEMLVTTYEDCLALRVTFTRTDMEPIEDPVRRTELITMRHAFEQIWEDVIAEGVRRGELRNDLDVKVTTFAVIGMINWMYKWYSPT